MSDTVLPGDPPIALHLRRSGRARRISLRISQLDGRVTLTMPKGLDVGEAIAFAQQKETWIRKHLGARGSDIPVEVGTQLPVGGRMLNVVSSPGRRVEMASHHLAVPGPAARVGPRVCAWLKEMARDRLAGACDDYAAMLGKSYTRLTLRDTRSRWGSCTADGRLMFSWRLIMAPADVLDYVAAHEVAHLARMDHSPAFWAEVERLYGDYDAPRRWLRKEGNALHRYRF